MRILLSTDQKTHAKQPVAAWHTRRSVNYTLISHDR